MKKRILCMAMMAVAVCAPAVKADDAADLKSAQELAEKYYATTRKAKDIVDIVPLMAKKNQEKVKSQPVPPEMHEMAMQMLRSHVPNSYKVTAQKVEPGKVTLTLESTDFPKEQVFPMPKGAVAHGEFVAINEAGAWKVYKDYWFANSADGKEKTSFGTNPDDADKIGGDAKPGDDVSAGKDAPPVMDSAPAAK